MRTSPRNRRLGAVLCLNAALLLGWQGPAPANGTVRSAPELCWIEYNSGEAPPSFAAAGLRAEAWRTTNSSLLVRTRRGDVLIEAGWSTDYLEHAAELIEPGRTMTDRIVRAAPRPTPTAQALAAAGVSVERLHAVLPTHGHLDHLGGAQDLPGLPILLTPDEIAFLDRQIERPTIVAPSTVRALRSRFRPLALSDRPYLGFSRSADVLGDGSIVAVPLPGHTPGGLGFFVNAGRARYFLVGDAAWMSEALERGLPKVDPLRSTLEADADEGDRTTAALATFHRSHPDIAIVPAHDRTAWVAAFGSPDCRPRPAS
jgi:glyoxylase-like metal-dependent hydrolase (beta-lactamase superfamily II)